MIVQPTEREEIAGRTQAGNLSDSDSCNIGLMAKLLPLMNIGQMHFNGRQTDRRNGISNSGAGMGIGGWVNDDPIISRPSLLNPGDQFTFAIRLAQIHLDPQLLRQLRDGCVQGLERLGPVDRRLPGPEEIEIWAVQDSYS